MKISEEAAKTLESWKAAGAVLFEDGKAFLRVKTTLNGVEGEAAINLSDVVGITPSTVSRFINANDEGGAAKRAYLSASRKALLAGALSSDQFDAMFGNGEAAKVIEAEKSREAEKVHQGNADQTQADKANADEPKEGEAETEAAPHVHPGGIADNDGKTADDKPHSETGKKTGSGKGAIHQRDSADSHSKTGGDTGK